MSGTFVTPDGFQKKTLAEIKIDYENLFKGVFGDDIDLDADGPFGQIIGLLSKRDADIWDGAAEIYTARNPSQATGASLDAISEETGVFRIDATETTISNVLLFGTEGTLVSAGREARQPNVDVIFSLDSDVTISQSNCGNLLVSVDDGSSPNENFTITINGDVYNVLDVPGTSLGPATALALVNLINAATNKTYSAEQIGSTNEFRVVDNENSMNITLTSNINTVEIGSQGNFTADVEGPNSVPTGTLTEIVTPVSGWDSVTNPIAGITGRNEESDADLRIRRQSSTQVGKGTEEALYFVISNEVEGVTDAIVTSNRTLTDNTGTGGLPPKSFEAVVQGGDDNDIAEAIWETMPAGIQDYGNTTIPVVDSQGVTQQINFSRPDPKYLWVNIDYTLYSEEDFPDDGEDQIKQAIVDWSVDEYKLGKDVIRQRLNIPIYTIPGIGSITVTIDVTNSPAGPPTYVSNDFPIATREFAVADVSRIVTTEV